MTASTVPNPAGPTAVVILAAGQGTRMKSTLPKVLHAVGGRSLLGHAMVAGRELAPAHLAVVVRHGRDQVAAEVTRLDAAALVVDQDEVPGTGRAAQVGLEALDAAAGQGGTAGGISGAVVVTASDVPLLDGATLGQLVAAHREDGNAVTILTTVVADATGYGRIVREDGTGDVLAIVEHKDATDAQREIREINTSIFVFDADVLRRGLRSVTQDNAQGEMYLTDVVAFARAEGRTVRAVITDDPMTVEGTNDRLALSVLGAELNRRILERWMLDGVTIVDPRTTWIDVDVDLAPDVTILPGTQLHGATKVEAGATIGPDTTLTDVEVGEGATVTRTHGSLAIIEAGATVGPFSFLRPGTVLGAKGKIGAFVEVKNSQIGAGSKVPHLSYVGDATIGEGTNLGAATIVANYDGVAKHRSVIGSQVRTGSDTVLVAPVTIGDGAYTAAGSVITQDVPAGALGVGRAQQHNSAGWVERKRPGTPAAQASAAASAGAAAAPTSQNAPTSDADPASEGTSH
ncbi:UDP-N-acetylglucosamine pyrophosphorylase [Xylanimonas cellulosilytica DSM 15894]|uniref:Bifunctional protein GlmU n=1 Tax=Xylanimonas cellulosilytica (strain DSM 15894 / JCM 12276 / CECT 5975 / KCTC 9989 / LMG 20990 / NBRC 107835 / XIL07) TaxID=446471 RepID=D1BXT2_XYLCX|nr:bifunctional UDP-N-acetylglucosamine diphosphorylase/glucosamine-1-phosphate N-acetyltransferase GlmU [Xylanimonas cellulosilytica]ACZ31723.1 UDP-N-acetylglucosamine pyrophosphorylase [Xylanimonas cellulosilytica DSM 15894]